jgi:hypothetical protein
LEEGSEKVQEREWKRRDMEEYCEIKREKSRSLDVGVKV